MGDQVGETDPDQADHGRAGCADDRQQAIVLRHIDPGGFAHQLRRGADLEHIVKAHQEQGIEDDVHII